MRYYNLNVTKMLRNLPIQYKHWLPLLTVGLVCFLTQFGLSELQLERLIYIRNDIVANEYWRFFTHSFVHTNTYHLSLNLGGLVLLWALHGEYYSWRNIFTLLLWLAFSTSITLYWLHPSTDYYMGLSAPLHGLFVFGAVLDVYSKRPGGWLLLIGLSIKLLLENITDNSSTALLIEADVATFAHLLGAISGLCFTLMYWQIRLSPKTHKNK